MTGLDGFAAVLKALRDSGTIALSRLSDSSVEKLRPLLDSNVLSRKAKGKGGVLQVMSMDHLLKYIDSRYPSGIDQIKESDGSRAASVMQYRNSKKDSRRKSIPVLLRGFCDVYLTSDHRILRVSELTESFGSATFILCKETMDIGYSGDIATVENLEFFTNFHKICSDRILVIYTGGRVSGLLLEWLSSPAMAGAGITHYGDYDPVGLCEYLRIKDKCPGRTRLFIPENLEELVARYGNSELLEKSSALIPGLRGSGDVSVARVINALDATNRALEQEILLTFR
jgi:hypothetical protein